MPRRSSPSCRTRPSRPLWLAWYHARIMAAIRLLAVLALAALFVPQAAFASTAISARTLVIYEPIAENTYLAGTDVTVAAPIGGDLVAAGGTLGMAAMVAGDATLAGGTVSVRRPVAGDLRIAGGQVTVEAPVSGDLLALGASITASSSAREVRLAGGQVHLEGAAGDVTIYGADVYLSGTIAGDVTVTASDKLSLADGTHITGTLRYNAPQQAGVPPGGAIDGGIEYTGSSPILPTNEEAKRFALAGAGVFFLVRVIAALVAAGLLAGLFPELTDRVAERTLGRSTRRFVLEALLGFGVIVAAPVLILLLLVSFVGIALAAIIAAGYVLLLLLSYLFAGILAGHALMRGVLKRTRITWRTAVLGMLALHLIGSIPWVGGIAVAVLTAASTGALVSIFYRFAFRRADALTLDTLEADA